MTRPRVPREPQPAVLSETGSLRRRPLATHALQILVLKRYSVSAADLRKAAPVHAITPDDAPTGSFVPTPQILTKTLTFAQAFQSFTSDVIWLIVISFFFAKGCAAAKGPSQERRELSLSAERHTHTNTSVN